MKKSAPKYYENLHAPIQCSVSPSPQAPIHNVEFEKIMNGEPLRIHPTKCDGSKVMTIEEWSALWKRSEAFPQCLACGSQNTKEHFFIQSWCAGRKRWDSESLCLDCFMFSSRSYKDPEWRTPEENQKAKWMQIYRESLAKKKAESA